MMYKGTSSQWCDKKVITIQSIIATVNMFQRSQKAYELIAPLEI